MARRTLISCFPLSISRRDHLCHRCRDAHRSDVADFRMDAAARLVGGADKMAGEGVEKRGTGESWRPGSDIEHLQLPAAKRTYRMVRIAGPWSDR
jgi:hypothetical protein